MSGLWGDQMRYQYRDSKRKQRARRAKVRKARINAVKHPARTAWRKWGLW